MLTRIVHVNENIKLNDVVNFEGLTYLVKFTDESKELTRLYLEPITIKTLK
jgi:hypothetical protein